MAEEEQRETNPNVTETDTTAYMDSVLNIVKGLFREAILVSFPDLVDPPVDVKVSSHPAADFQCNSAMPLVKLLKINPKPNEKPMNPRQIADLLAKNLPPSDVIKSVDIAGPGFINVVVNEIYLGGKIKDLIVNGVNVKKTDPRNKVLIDYSSPNIAKEMHVGHLRSTIIGDCLANILEFVGYDVLRINHVGDWGTQFGMLLANLIEKFPNYLNQPPPIRDLQAFYKEAKTRFDGEEEFKKRAYDTVVRLQSKDPDVIKAWQMICDLSRKEFQEIYDRLNIRHLVERGESFYQEPMVELVKQLKAKNLLEDDNGRLIFWPSGKRSIPLIVVKSDGGFTYDTSDLACIQHRAQIDKAERIIYVVDAGQSSHFQILFPGARDAGLYDPNRTTPEHVCFGAVLGEDKKKFKTRSGDTVRLRDLLDEGMDRALAKLLQKERDKVLTPEELRTAQEATAIGCIKYSDLANDRNHEYQFSFDRMLDDRGNTAVYLLYALTRIRSISRNANLDKSATELASSLPSVVLEHEREIKLAKQILKFAEVILQVSEDLYPHTLCTYLYDLSSTFSEFYDKCYVIEKYEENGEAKTRVNINRILLCEATALVMEKGLEVLGLKTCSKM